MKERYSFTDNDEKQIKKMASLEGQELDTYLDELKKEVNFHKYCDLFIVAQHLGMNKNLDVCTPSDRDESISAQRGVGGKPIWAE